MLQQPVSVDMLSSVSPDVLHPAINEYQDFQFSKSYRIPLDVNKQKRPSPIRSGK